MSRSSAGVRAAFVEAAYRSARVPELLSSGARAAISGMWLGLLTDEELDALDERYYDATPVYRTAEWNERGLFDWERTLVEQHLPGAGRVAVLGCGGGREVLALLAMGYDATGYESHPELAAFAEDLLAGHGERGRVSRVPRSSFEAGPDSFDAIVLGWGMFSLVPDANARLRLLQACSTALRSNGRVLLSCVERSGDLRELRVTCAIANRIRRARGAPLVMLGDTLAPNRVHLFSRSELTSELLDAGLRAVAWWSSAQPGAPTAQTFLVAALS